MAFILISLFVTFLVTILYLVSFWVSLKRGSKEKLSPYESGFEPTKDARIQFDILFWRVALLYLIFDLELIFLFPYGSIITFIHTYSSLTSLLFFLIVITLAFLYEYYKGALNLDNTRSQNL